MTAPIEVLLPLRTRNPLNTIAGSRGMMLGRARERAANRLATKLAIGAYVTEAGGPAAILPCRVTLTRIAPSAGLDPFDGLPASLKSIVDGVADALGLANDRTPLVEWKAEQRRGRPGAYAVLVRVDPREGAST